MIPVWFWVFTHLPMTLALLIGTLLERAFIGCHRTKITSRAEGESVRTGPEGWACSSLAEPKYITSIYLTKDPTAKHWQNPKATDYT